MTFFQHSIPNAVTLSYSGPPLATECPEHYALVGTIPHWSLTENGYDSTISKCTQSTQQSDWITYSSVDSRSSLFYLMCTVTSLVD